MKNFFSVNTDWMHHPSVLLASCPGQQNERIPSTKLQQDWIGKWSFHRLQWGKLVYARNVGKFPQVQIQDAAKSPELPQTCSLHKASVYSVQYFFSTCLNRSEQIVEYRERIATRGLSVSGQEHEYFQYDPCPYHLVLSLWFCVFMPSGKVSQFLLR